MADSYLDKINRREVEIQAFANYLIKQYSDKGITEAYKAARLALLEMDEITSRAKLNRVIAEIRRNTSPIYSDMWDDITTELNAFGTAEAVFAAKTLSEFAPVNIKTPAKKKTQEYVQRAIMSLDSGSGSSAGVWTDFTKQATNREEQALISAIKSGYARGETTQQIIGRLRTVSGGITKNQADTLIRTGTTHYSQQANLYMRDDNRDVLEGGREIPVITFDSRTSLICASISAKYQNGWPVGKSPIGYPAYHYNCRTKIIFLPKGAKLEGDRPAIEGRKGKEGEEAFERKTGSPKKYTGRKDKAFKAKQIPVETSYAKFLKSQPQWFVQKVLGKTRADAFIAGKLDLSKLTNKPLKPLSVEQLGLE